MEMIWLYSLVSVFLVSVVSLLGIFTLSLREEKLSEVTLFLVSFAVGALFGDTLFHLLPETFRRSGWGLGGPMLVILGILIFFVLEKFLHWRHCHASPSEGHLHPMVTINLVSDAVHNLIDGILIGASYLVNPSLGITTTLAILFHEIPQEIGDFGVLVRGGMRPKRALLFNYLSALFAVAGTVLVLLLGFHVRDHVFAMIPITAGGFIYLAGSDLIPELHQEVRLHVSLVQFFLMLVGIGIMALLALWEFQGTN